MVTLTKEQGAAASDPHPRQFISGSADGPIETLR